MNQSLTAECRQEHVLVVEPNRNLSWKATKWVMFFFACCLFIVAAYFTSVGAWLVIPFAGIEFIVIGTALYQQCCYAHQKQIISIDDNAVSVSEKGRQLISIPKPWLKIVHKHDPHGWYSSRLYIGAHGRFVELGKYLIESERKRLADDIRGVLQGV